MENSKKVIKNDIFRLSPHPFVIGSKDGEEQKEPEIFLKREKDAVVAIEVKCVCGRLINIECI